MRKLRSVGLIVALLVLMLVLTSCGAPIATDPNAPPNGWWETLIVFPLAAALSWMNKMLQAVGMPYSYGFAIILFTILIKVVTLPLTMAQLRSMRTMQHLQPRMQELQKKHGKDREALSKAQMEMYKEAGYNPAGGCLPLLVQMPILFGLYQALYRLTNIGELVNQAFFWIPDLAYPVQSEGMGWITAKFAAGQYGTLVGYLILPVLLVLTQIMLQKMSQPATASKQDQDPQQATMQQTMTFMPLIFGFVFISLPAGLSLYYVVSNILSMIQQYFVTGWGSLKIPGITLSSIAPAMGTPGQSSIPSEAKITESREPETGAVKARRRTKKRK